MNRFCLWLLSFAAVAIALRASDPGPTQAPNAVNPPYHGASINNPFPDNYYGADHGGSSLSLSYPFTSRFGNTDHSRGAITYYCAPFTPRNSEGVYGMDVWLEASVGGGAWNVAGVNNGLADGAGSAYQPVNTPNPGPSPAYQFQWTFDSTPFPPETTFRVFVYVYLYNQGGGSQGNFYVGTSAGSVSSGAANDAPAIVWDPSYGSVNPANVGAGSTYLISATATDDNGNLSAVQIFRNGQAFASSGGGDGWTSNAADSSADAGGTITYAARATDAGGLTSPTISLTVTIAALLAQPAVSSVDATLNLGQAFVPAELGGAGAGGWQFAIGGYTNFNGGATNDTGTDLPAGSWVPTWTAQAAGSYSFWISRNGDGTYAPSAIAGPYTLTVTEPSQPSAPSTPVSPPSTPPVVTPPSDPTGSGSTSTTSSGSSSGSSSSGSTSNPPTYIPLTPINTQVNPPAPAPPTSIEIARIRFNATGHDAAMKSIYSMGISALWTDPAGLAASPWPTFSPAPAATVSAGFFPLPQPASR